MAYRLYGIEYKPYEMAHGPHGKKYEMGKVSPFTTILGSYLI